MDKLERLTARIGDAAMAFGRSDLIDGDGRSFGRDLLQTLRSPRRPDDRLLTIFRPQISGHAMIATPEVIPESVFASNEPFDWLIGLLATFSRGVVYDHGAVVHHRLHDSNSHNVTIRLRMNPFLLRPRHLEMWLERRNRARERLVAAVELLAQSEVIPREDSVIFAELAEACRAVWAERRPILEQGRAAKLILSSLRVARWFARRFPPRRALRQHRGLRAPAPARYARPLSLNGLARQPASGRTPLVFLRYPKA